MDFLAEALRANQLKEKECNDFIRIVRNNGSKLPVNTITEYLRNFTVRVI
jgi:hypothetical protein